jgi:plastocyanin
MDVMVDRRRARLTLGLAAAVLAAALVAGTALAADHAVAISGFSFSPANLTVTVGDTVTWTNSDAQAHTATADDASFDTGAISNGASGTVTFATAGTFPYHCSIHTTMTGTVTVEAAAAPTPTARPTTPPTDTVTPSGDGGWPMLPVLLVAGLWVVAFAVAMARRRGAQR